MKLTKIVTLACIITVNAQEWIAKPSHRILFSDYGALVSGIRDNEDWCVTAPNGAKLGAKVGFRLCDGSTRQIWNTNEWPYKWRSGVDLDRCMAVGSGKLSDIKDGAFLRMVNCSAATEMGIDEKDLMKVSNNTKFCMVNSGSNPSSSDAMIIKTCVNTDKRFKFSFEVKLDYSSFQSDAPDKVNGCLGVKNETPVKGQGLIHGDCDLNHNWRIDSSGLFHTELDDEMCMQAAPKLAGGSLLAGVRLRLDPCDANDKNQKFTYDGQQIRPKENESLCVGYEGKTGEIGKDPIILKPCSAVGTAYSSD